MVFYALVCVSNPKPDLPSKLTHMRNPIRFITTGICFSVLAISTCLGDVELARQGNPIIKDKYTADPAAMVYDGKVYLYTGHDEAPLDLNFYKMKDWLVYSSEDMVNWTEHPVPLSIDDFTWATQHAWAAHVIEKGGKFYWYITAFHNDEHPGFAVGRRHFGTNLKGPTRMHWGTL